MEVYASFAVLFARIENRLRMVMLISNRSKPCRYYQNGVCSIYESRPPACKLYPVTPYFDEILIDTSCPALGWEGLPIMEEGAVSRSFYHERLENFEQKLERTEEFLGNLDWKFRPVYEIDGIALLEYTGVQQNSFIQMHRASLKHLNHFT